MTRMRVSSIFAIIVLSSLPLCCQESQTASSFLSDLSPARLNSIIESRRLAHEELAQHSLVFETPNIAIALRFPFYLIAIAKITGVQLPDGATIPRTRIRFHVEHMIRGNGQVADFDVESRWTPKTVSQDEDTRLVTSMNKPTAFDITEPKVGDRYILGFPRGYGDGKLVFVPSVIDLQDPNQAELIGNAERFLAIEESAERSGFAPYLTALDDKAPWIRDIAVYRLTSSDTCNASPSCMEKFSDVVNDSSRAARRMSVNRLSAGLFGLIRWLAW
jgi:hypothetical protein